MRPLLLTLALLFAFTAAQGAQGIVFNGSSQYATVTTTSSTLVNQSYNFEFRIRGLRIGHGSDQTLFDLESSGKLVVKAVSAGVTNLEWQPATSSGTVTVVITGRTDMLARVAYNPYRDRYSLQVWNLDGTNTAFASATTTDNAVTFTSKVLRLGANRSAGEHTAVTLDWVHWTGSAHSVGTTAPFPTMSGYTYLYKLGFWEFESGAEVTDTSINVGTQHLTLTGTPTYSTTANTKPVANAGADQPGASLGTFWLDGHTSYDVEANVSTVVGLNDAVTWTQTSGPSATFGPNGDATKISTRVTPTGGVGTYVFSLTVVDKDPTTPLTSDPDSVSIVVVNPSASLSVPSTGWVGEPVLIDASASTGWGGNSGPGSISITLGDGPTTDPDFIQTIDKTAHTYLSAGVFNVAVTVTNASGTTATTNSNITISAIPAAGTSVTCTDQGSAAANAADCQTKINTAAAATSAEYEIILTAGVTWGPLTLPAITGTKSGSKYITIKSSVLASLPVSPYRRVGVSDLAFMPRIQSVTQNVLALTTIDNVPTNHWRLQGIEFYSASTQAVGIIEIGKGDGSIGLQTSTSQEPHHFIFDRVIVHGSATSETKTGIRVNGAYVSIYDSYIYDCHSVNGDAQAVGIINGSGPLSVLNSYLSGSGENFMAGGAEPSVEYLVPSDIEFRRNYLFKPLTWKLTDPSTDGFAWSIKNLFELKNGRRIQITGNYMKHNWAQGQDGTAIIFNTSFDSGDWAEMRDIAFTHNYVTKMGNAFLLRGHDHVTWPVLARITIAHNVFDEIDITFAGGSLEKFMYVAGGPMGLRIEHNTIRTQNVASSFAFHGDGESKTTASRIANNIFHSGLYGLKGEEHYPSGGDATFGVNALNRYFPNADWVKNVINVTSLDGSVTMPNTANNYAPANDAAIGFTDLANKDYRLTGASAYYNVGTDGTDPGANLTAQKLAVGASTFVFSTATFNDVTGIWTDGIQVCNWHTSPSCSVP